MYADSNVASHSVVQGSLRENFISAALKGHIPNNIVWSMGQIIGYAPAGKLSGQLDIILHSSALPQIHLYDGHISIVPSDSCIGVVEVKSQLTTGGETSNPLKAAMESLKAAKSIGRQQNSSDAPVPFHIFAFKTTVKLETIVKKIDEFLSSKALDPKDYWPDSIVILEGPANHDPNGYGLFRESNLLKLPKSATQIMKAGNPRSPAISKVPGANALACLIALLTNSAIEFSGTDFRLERYLYDTK